MRYLTTAIVALGTILAVPAYAGDANHSAGATGALGGSSSGGVLRPMPRPAGFTVYGNDFYGYNPGAISAAGSTGSYATTMYSNGQRIDGIMGSDGTFYATKGTHTVTTAKPASRPSSSKTRDDRPTPGKSNLGNKGGSAKDARASKGKK